MTSQKKSKKKKKKVILKGERALNSTLESVTLRLLLFGTHPTLLLSTDNAMCCGTRDENSLSFLLFPPRVLSVPGTIFRYFPIVIEMKERAGFLILNRDCILIFVSIN